MKRIGISSDCMCDLPEEYLKENDIGIVYFYITTSTGRFRDGYEITSGNILEYLENGGEKSDTAPPSIEEFKKLFEKMLKRYDEIVHFAISQKLDNGFENAVNAAKLIGENKITIVDSGHLSTGIGHMVINAVDMRDRGCSSAEIEEASKAIRERISTTFMTKNVEYLYRNGRVSKWVNKLCKAFMLYPILTMKNGYITLKSIGFGSYENALTRYVRKELKHSKNIDKKRLFITHAGCTVKTISQVKTEVEKLCKFDEMIVTKASATISGNCGPDTIGVLFVRTGE